LERLAAFCPQHDTARLCGKALPPQALNDDPVGRVLDRLDAVGPMKIVTACAVRAEQVFGWDTRYGHFETTSVRVYGESLPPETPPKQEASQEQQVPGTIP
jgi:transposase